MRANYGERRGLLCLRFGGELKKDGRFEEKAIFAELRLKILGMLLPFLYKILLFVIEKTE